MKKKRNTKITRNNTFFLTTYTDTHWYIGSNEINVKNDENFPIVILASFVLLRNAAKYNHIKLCK